MNLSPRQTSICHFAHAAEGAGIVAEAVATSPAFLYRDSEDSFEEQWPELGRRLDGFLAARGVEAWTRNDVIQETAERLYVRWATLDHSRPLWNLAVTVSLRILCDEQRKASRVELVAQPPEPEVDDVERRALHRIQLLKTHAALGELNSDQRRVLLAEIGEASPPEGTRNRINVLRMRTRIALKNKIGQWSPAAVVMRINPLKSSVERRLFELGRELQTIGFSIVNVAIAATLAVGLPDVTGSSHGQPEDPPHSVEAMDVRNDLDFARSRAATLGDSPGAARRAPEKEDATGESPTPLTPVQDAGMQTRDKAQETGEQAHGAWQEAGKKYRQGGRRAKKGWTSVRDTYQELTGP